MEDETGHYPSIPEVLKRPLIFVNGKGGVGKTVISKSITRAFHKKGLKSLWVCFEDPRSDSGLRKEENGPDFLNAESTKAFEEYITQKIKIAAVAKIFVKNKLIQFLAKAAPGIHELVLLGKVWHETENYDRVVVDMPSTGYGLAMFKSTENFSRLFTGGPIQGDAGEMLKTFSNPEKTGNVILSLPEEMPLQESLDLRDYLAKLFPENSPSFLINKRFPHPEEATKVENFISPLPTSAHDYITKRISLESENLRIWESEGIRSQEIDYFPPPLGETTEFENQIADFMIERGFI